MKEGKHKKVIIILIISIFILIIFVAINLLGKPDVTQLQKTADVNGVIKEDFTPSPTLSPTAKIEVTPFVPTKEPENTILAKITFYGWSDNDPPGKAIAYPKSRFPQVLHEVAGGVGTYNDPLTFAANENQFVIGAHIYLPYLKKYAIKEDLCPNCGGSGQIHVDLWMESDGNYPAELNACEGAFTREREMIIIDPPSDKRVDTIPLFDLTNGNCRSGI